MATSDKVTNEISEEALKLGHRLVHGVAKDIEAMQFNTAIAKMMGFMNDFTQLPIYPRGVVKMATQALAPFAPHIAEEMYHLLGNTGTVCDAQWPQFNEEYLKESSVNYPVSFNGKVRFTLQLPADTSREEVERTALANEQTQKYLEGKSPKKVIVVPGKIVNIVV